MVDIKVTEVELRAGLAEAPTTARYWCPLRAWAWRAKCVKVFDLMCVEQGLTDTQAQAWAIMAGWDDTSMGPQRFGPGRYTTHFDVVVDAAWYALGARLAHERLPPDLRVSP